MNSVPNRISSVKTKLIKPFNNIDYSLNDIKRTKQNIFTSYLKNKNYPLFNKFDKHFKNIINPFSIVKKNNTSDLLLSMKNLINKRTKEKLLIKRKIHIKINNKPRNNTIKHFNTKKEINYENKFKSRYKYIIRNLSYNGNSKKSFKNLSNDILDDLFQDKHFNSYFESTTQKSPIFPNKSLKFNNEKIYNKNNNAINISIKENNKDKYINKKQLTNLSYLTSKAIFNKKCNDNYKKEKKVNFDLIFLKNEFNSKNYSENSQDTPDTSGREKNNKKIYNSFNRKVKTKNNIIKSKKHGKLNIGTKFKALKIKLRKQNDINNDLINNIKKEQSLSKYKLQIGIVQLNGHKPKKNELKNTK